MTSTDELEKLLAEATPLPWYVGHNELGNDRGPMSIWPDPQMVGAIIAMCGKQRPWEGWREQPAKDAALICAAVNALPELLGRVRRLEEIEKCARYVDDAPTVGEKSMRLGELLQLCRARAALNQEQTHASD